jgi:hypothetical protein
MHQASIAAEVGAARDWLPPIVVGADLVAVGGITVAVTAISTVAAICSDPAKSPAGKGPSARHASAGEHMAASESAHAASETTCVETAAMKTGTSSTECRGWSGCTDREGAREGRENDRFCDAVHETLLLGCHLLILQPR